MNLKLLCKSLGNEERVRLVCCLQKKQTVSELLARCNISQSALSQHLKILRDSKIISASRDGKYIKYVTTSSQALNIAKLLVKYK